MRYTLHATRCFLGIAVALSVALSAGAFAAEQKKAADAPQPAAKAQDRDAKDREYFTDLELMTHEGRKVRFYTDMLRDKVVLISTYYINCGAACPLQNVQLSKLQGLLGERFGRDIFIVSVSVDPENDKWELVRDYAKVWHVKPGWTFLTGKKVNMDWVNYKMGLYVPRPEDHDTRFIAMNMKTGRKQRLDPRSTAEQIAFVLLSYVEDNKNAGK